MMKQILLLSALAIAVFTVAQADDVCIVLTPDEYKPFVKAAATNCTSAPGAVSCTIDFAPLPASKALEKTCSNITGATFMPQDLSKLCTFKGETFVALADNVPYCLTASCDEAQIKDSQQEVVDYANSVYKELGVDCAVGATNSGAIRVAGFAAIAVSFVAFLLV